MLQKGRLCIFLGALNYLGEFKEKCKLLQLNKEINKKLREPIYEQVLNKDYFIQINQVKMWWGYLQVGVIIINYSTSNIS